MQSNLTSDIKKLKEEIKPRSEWTALNRDVLLRQINPNQTLKPQSVGVGGLVDLFNQMFRQTVMEPAVMMILVLGIFLGSSLTINAAFYALPGDELYPVKLTLEKTHVALMTSEEKKVELKIEFAQKRVAELSKVISQPDSPESKKKKIETVAKEFKNNVASVNSHLANIAKTASAETKNSSDPSNSVSMALTVSEKTGELAKSFDKTASELSADEQIEVKQIVAEAVESAQETSLAAQQIVDDSIQADEAAATGEVKGADNEAVPISESDSQAVEDTTTNTQSAVEGESAKVETVEPIE